MSVRPRWRWITLAEVVAIAGLVIAVTTLWLSWSDRRADDADRRRSQQAETVDRARLSLTGTVASGGDAIDITDPHHDLTDLGVAFPSPLAIAVQHPVTPRIEADWFAKPVLALAVKAKADEGRVPVLLTVSYIDGDMHRTATGVYDVVWRADSRFLRGRVLRLEAMRLRQRGGSRATVDDLWRREQPR